VRCAPVGKTFLDIGPIFGPDSAAWRSSLGFGPNGNLGCATSVYSGLLRMPNTYLLLDKSPCRAGYSNRIELNAARMSRATKQRDEKNSFRRLHARKTRSRSAQLRARQQGRSYQGFCLAKHVDPAVFKRPLNLSKVEVPLDDED